MLIRVSVSLLLGFITTITSENYLLLSGTIVALITFVTLSFDKIISSSVRYPIFMGFIGMGIGFWFSSLLGNAIKQTAHLETVSILLVDKAPLMFYMIFGVMGFYFGYQGFNQIGLHFPVGGNLKREKKNSILQKILDTSSIIDGRIIDVCETGFVEGVIIVPKFVLNELQQVADSTDPMKRSRGRKGLNELNRLKQSKLVTVKIYEKDYNDIKEVDHKLVRMCKEKEASLVTTDYNLNKIASLEGVKVLNVNDLANTLKPLVMANEELRLVIVKEGKDPDQGIGYLDDGTMVVVDGGKKYLGHEIDLIVTSVLQTAAGRMVFTQPKIDRREGGNRR
ncbi:MAG: PIN domain nuclease [Spirochaetae bacterium HGW-Spirochaetae-6]|jgi:uncharacterized protein YacL|nr:MAG: PIN domain nuclease [Spirochaetae bacterium HGW-Spirochaetae-6]